MSRKTFLNLRIDSIERPSADKKPMVEIREEDALKIEQEHRDEETDLSSLVRLVSSNQVEEEETKRRPEFQRKKMPKIPNTFVSRIGFLLS